MGILEDIYRGMKWPMAPDDPKARERFGEIRVIMASLVDEGLISGTKILDLMAGSGIAGAALASELSSRGLEGSVLAVDAREEDLRHLPRWLEIGGARGFIHRGVVCDVTRLPECLEGPYDVAIIWGSSLPHLSTWDFVLTLAGISDLCSEECTLLVEQRDLLPRILVSNDYRHVLAEGEIVHFHAGYDALRGMIRRLYYTRDMKFLGEGEYRLWDIASVATIIWLFFSEFSRRRVMDMGNEMELIVARRPRNALKWNNLFTELKKLLKS